MVIGLPLSPLFDQSLLSVSVVEGTVLPNLTELPHLPSIILSPAKDNKGCIFDFSTKVPPTNGEL